MPLFSVQNVAVFRFFDPLEQFEVFHYGYISSTFCAILFFNSFIMLFLFLNYAKLNIFSFTFSSLFVFFKSLFTSVFGYKNQGFFFQFFFIFLFILVNNFIGLLPYTYTLTSYLLLPLFFSFTVIGSSVFIGFEQRGLRFFSFFHPTAPKLILHFLILIEVVSYVTRLFSLSIRLFANMVAGHALLKILLSFTWAIFMSFSLFSALSIFFWALIIAITVLEFLIAFLQAYVFVFLSMLYLKEVL